MRRLRLLSPLFFLMLPLFAQAPGSIDGEGNLYFQNGTGRYPLKRKGVWKNGALTTPGGNASRVPSITPAERQAITATLNRIASLLQETPEGGILEGYWMKVSMTFDYPHDPEQPPGLSAARAPLSFAARFAPFFLEDILRNGQYVPQWGGETETIPFTFNRLPGPITRAVLLEETLPNEQKYLVYPRPRVTGEYKGFPVLEDDTLMIARPGRDPYAPVPLGRALRLALVNLQKDRDSAEQELARRKQTLIEVNSPAYEQQMRDHLEKQSGAFRTTNPSRWQTRLAGMERELKYNREKAARDANPPRDADGLWYWNRIDAHEEAVRRLAALTPAEAEAPACYRPAEGDARYRRAFFQGTVLRAGEPNCEPLVTGNPAYFDQKLPRSAPQILTFHFGRCMKNTGGRFEPIAAFRPSQPNQGCIRHVVYWDQADWQQIAALVVR